jgi:hypothetical protein
MEVIELSEEVFEKGNIEFEDFGRHSLRLLNFVGISFHSEVPTTKRERIKALAKKCFYLASLVAFMIFSLCSCAWIYLNMHELTGVMFSIPTAINQFLVTVKMLIFHCKRDKIGRLYNRLCKHFPYYKHDQEKYNVAGYYSGYMRFIKAFAIFLVIYFILVLIGTIRMMVDFGTEHLIFNTIWLPFDHKNVFVYLLVTLWIYWTIFNVTVFSDVAEGFIFHFIVVLSMEFDILAHDFGETLNNVSVSSEDIKQLVIHQNNLIDMSNQLQDIFSDILLGIFLKSSVVICLYAFSFVIFDDISRVILLLVFAMHLVQIFFLCYFGQKLISSNESIARAVNASNWNEIKSKKVKRLVPFIMQRSQTPKRLTARGFKVISHETFTDVSKCEKSYDTNFQASNCLGYFFRLLVLHTHRVCLQPS